MSLRVKTYVDRTVSLRRNPADKRARMAADVAQRVRELRKARGLTQEQLAVAGGLERVEVVQIESGKNQAGSSRIGRALAKGARVGLEDLFKYLDGEIGLDDLLRAPSTPRPLDAGPFPNRSLAVMILKEARFPADIIAKIESEEPERDRTAYGWIKLAEALAYDFPPPAPIALPPATKTTAPPTPPKSTRRSHK